MMNKKISRNKSFSRLPFLLTITFYEDKFVLMNYLKEGSHNHLFALENIGQLINKYR